MIRSALGKAMWVGRTASAVLGLALVLALIFGVATVALAANGNNFVLGVLNNSATSVTRLTADVSGGPALQVVNNNTAAGSRALQLNVAQNKPPLAVNAAAGKAANLNADELDGLDSAAFEKSGTIHRFGPFVLAANSGQRVLSVGPFEINGICSDTAETKINLFVQESARPYSLTVQSTQGNATVADTSNSQTTLAQVAGVPRIGSVTGSALSYGGKDEQITYHLYQARTTNIFGNEFCTFGGYVVGG